VTDKKQGMTVFAPDGSVLMEIAKIERSGDNLILHGKIMGSLPMKAVLRPEQARRGLGLLSLKTILFLPTLLFRKRKRPG
jgi:hypothetical protein